MNQSPYARRRPNPNAAKYRPLDGHKLKRTFVIAPSVMIAVDTLAANLETPQSHVVELALRLMLGQIERGELSVPTTVAARRIEMPPIQADQAAAGDD